MTVLKVASSSSVPAVAGAIAGIFREAKHATVQAIGVASVYQALKAIILAKSYLSGDGHTIAFIPELVDVQIKGNTFTLVKQLHFT